MGEIWKRSTDAEGYEISNCGNVRNARTKKVLHPVIRNGYPCIVTKPFGKYSKSVSYSIHRMVAKEFIRNPLNLPQVNHISGNKLDNHVENLEWVTAKENTQHAIQHGLRDGVVTAHTKPVVQISIKGILIQIFSSAPEAAKATGICRSSITNCTCGKSKTAGGFIWKRLADWGRDT